MMNGRRSRLEKLEARLTPPREEPRPLVRRRIREALDRIAAAKRGDLPEEEAAQVFAEFEAMEGKIRERRAELERGEGRS